MFEAITHTTPKVQGGGIPSGTVVPLRAPAGVNIRIAPESKKPMEQTDQAKQRAEEQPQEESTQQVTRKLISELEQDIETIHNIGLQFSLHNATGRTMIKIMDKATEKVIREIPSEEVLNLAAKIEEMIGILFDRKA